MCAPHLQNSMLLHLQCYRYLNSSGIIGDVVHSHIFQTIALLAMEPPVTLDGEDVRNEKVSLLFICIHIWFLDIFWRLMKTSHQVKLLRSIRKLETGDVIIGCSAPASGGNDAAKLSKRTPTYFAAALYIDNARWDGVPFMIKVGRGLNNHRYD